jgi:hypothetical protein
VLAAAAAAVAAAGIVGSFKRVAGLAHAAGLTSAGAAGAYLAVQHGVRRKRQHKVCEPTHGREWQGLGARGCWKEFNTFWAVL